MQSSNHYFSTPDGSSAHEKTIIVTYFQQRNEATTTRPSCKAEHESRLKRAHKNRPKKESSHRNVARKR